MYWGFIVLEYIISFHVDLLYTFISHKNAPRVYCANLLETENLFDGC